MKWIKLTFDIDQRGVEPNWFLTFRIKMQHEMCKTIENNNTQKFINNFSTFEPTFNEWIFLGGENCSSMLDSHAISRRPINTGSIADYSAELNTSHFLCSPDFSDVTIYCGEEFPAHKIVLASTVLFWNNLPCHEGFHFYRIFLNCTIFLICQTKVAYLKQFLQTPWMISTLIHWKFRM